MYVFYLQSNAHSAWGLLSIPITTVLAYSSSTSIITSSLWNYRSQYIHHSKTRQRNTCLFLLTFSYSYRRFHWSPVADYLTDGFLYTSGDILWPNDNWLKVFVNYFNVRYCRQTFEIELLAHHQRDFLCAETPFYI